MDTTPKELFYQHVAALEGSDFDSLVSHYAEDALVLTTTGDYRGRDAIRDGVDTFVFDRGMIRIHAISCAVTPKD